MRDLRHAGRPNSRSSLRLLGEQLRYHNRLFWRNPRSAFSTFILPLLLLVLIDGLNGSQLVGGVRYAQLVTPGVAIFGIVSVCYTNLATSTVAARDRGILKRLRGTPLPPWLYLAGRILFSTSVAFLQTALIVAVAVAFFRVRPIGHTLVAAVATVLLGTVVFCALGLAASALIPNNDAAPALLSATFIPLALISGVFFPVETGPEWLKELASKFPIEPFAAALQADFNPRIDGAGFQGRDLIVLAAWGFVGVFIALRRFRWEEGAQARGHRLWPNRTGERT